MAVCVNRGISLPAMITVESSSHSTAGLCGAVSNPCGMSDNSWLMRHWKLSNFSPNAKRYGRLPMISTFNNWWLPNKLGYFLILQDLSLLFVIDHWKYIHKLTALVGSSRAKMAKVRAAVLVQHLKQPQHQYRFVLLFSVEPINAMKRLLTFEGHSVRTIVPFCQGWLRWSWMPVLESVGLSYSLVSDARSCIRQMPVSISVWTGVIWQVHAMHTTLHIVRPYSLLKDPV